MHTSHRIGAAVAGLALFCLTAEASVLPWRHWLGWAVEPTAAEQLAYARKLESRDRLRAARGQYHALVKAWPLSSEAVEAQQAYARMLDDAGDPRKAFEAYRKLMQDYGEQIAREPVLERQLELALAVRDRRRGRFLFFPGFHAPEEALPMLEAILEEAPQWRRSDEVRYLLGATREACGKIEEALEAYRATQTLDPASPFAEKAGWAELELLYDRARSQPRHQALQDRAYAAASYFLSAYPQSPHRAEARRIRSDLYRTRARAAYNVAVYYDRLAREPEAALVSYRSFLQEFPLSPWTTNAEERIDSLSAEVEDEPETSDQ